MGDDGMKETVTAALLTIFVAGVYTLSMTMPELSSCASRIA